MFFLITLIGGSFLFVAPAFAHSDHDHYVMTKETAREVVLESLQRMTFRDMGYGVGKLDASWKEVGVDDVSVVEEIVDSGGYRLKVVNQATGQSLLMTVSNRGDVISATISQ